MSAITATRTSVTIGRYRWTPRRLRQTTWQMTLVKLLCAPIVGGAAVIALIGFGQPYVLHQDYTSGGVPIVEVQTHGR